MRQKFPPVATGSTKVKVSCLYFAKKEKKKTFYFRNAIPYLLTKKIPLVPCGKYFHSTFSKTFWFELPKVCTFLVKMATYPLMGKELWAMIEPLVSYFRGNCVSLIPTMVNLWDTLVILGKEKYLVRKSIYCHSK